LIRRTLYPAALAAAGLAVLTPAAMAVVWTWPVRGPVIQRFAYGPNPFARGQHRGIDIAAARRAPVVAACAGRVRFAGTIGTAGRTVSVTCGPYVASYLHLDAIAVRRGAKLARGAPLGTVGTTGPPGERRPHLQFGVRREGDRWGYVDPLRLLPGGKTAPPDATPPARGGHPRPVAPILPTPAPADLGHAPAASHAPALGRAPGGSRAPASPTALSAPARHPGPALGLPLGSLWLPLGTALALATIGAPLATVRIRRRRRSRRTAAIAAAARRVA
jgi:hypothetical protein